MTDLNLAELARLEQVATQGRQYYAHPKRHNPPYFLMRSTGDRSWSGIADYGAEWAEVELSTVARNQLRPLLNLVDGLAQQLEEARNQKVVLNGMTQEQKNSIFAIKAIVVDALFHYRQAKGGE